MNTTGFLIRITALPNDAALCDVFTCAFGKITLNVPQFYKSQKRQSQIQMGYLMNLSLETKGDRYILKEAIKLHRTKLYKLDEIQFLTKVLKWLQSFPESMPEPQVYNFVLGILESSFVVSEQQLLFEALEIKLIHG